MSNNELKYKIKGNESFSIREGWLAKGLFALDNNKYVFSEETAMDNLGVGSKMVKSIKYWLLASHLVEEKREKNAKHSLVPTQYFGEVVKKHDPYFEDIFTLWIIHYYITTDISFNTVWNLFFNRFNVTDFTKNAMVDKLVDECNKIYDKGNSLYNSIDSDCGVLLKMYTSSEETVIDPEENLTSPFSELGLIARGSERSSYMKVRPLYSKLDRLAVLYVMTTNLFEPTRNRVTITIPCYAVKKVGFGLFFPFTFRTITGYCEFAKPVFAYGLHFGISGEPSCY